MNVPSTLKLFKQNEPDMGIEQAERPVQNELRHENRLLRHHEGGQHDQEQPLAGRKFDFGKTVRRQRRDRART